MDLPRSHFFPRCPFSLHLSSQKEALWDCERWEELRGRVALLYTSAKKGLLFFFLLFVRGEINSVHVITFWQGETLSADIEERQERFKARPSSSLFPPFRVIFPQQNQSALSCLSLFSSFFLSLFSFFPSRWKGREWSASLTSWHHISFLVLRDASLLFSCVLW